MSTMLTSYVRTPGPRPVDGIGDDSPTFDRGFGDGWSFCVALEAGDEYLAGHAAGKDARALLDQRNVERVAARLAARAEAEHPQAARMRGQR